MVLSFIENCFLADSLSLALATPCFGMRLCRPRFSSATGFVLASTDHGPRGRQEPRGGRQALFLHVHYLSPVVVAQPQACSPW